LLDHGKAEAFHIAWECGHGAVGKQLREGVWLVTGHKLTIRSRQDEIARTVSSSAIVPKKENALQCPGADKADELAPIFRALSHESTSR
jgi:hypothetical protein